jgi:hypothetical protein
MSRRTRGLLLFTTAMVTTGGLVFGCSLLRELIHSPELAPNPLAGWVEVPIHAISTPKFNQFVRVALDTDRVCVVLREEGRIVVRMELEPIPHGPTLPFRLDIEEVPLLTPSRRVAAQVADGWLVGYDTGEWGGAVWWFSADGSTRRQVSDHRVHQFVQSPDGLFAVEGLNHLGLDRGHVLRLVMREGSWQAEEFAKLPGNGYAMATDADGSLIVATRNAVVRVTADGQAVTVAQVDWLFGHPNTIEIADGRVYAGVREAAVVVELQSGHARLFVPPDSPLVAK